MGNMDFNKEQIHSTTSLLAAVLHIGDIGFKVGGPSADANSHLHLACTMA